MKGIIKRLWTSFFKNTEQALEQELPKCKWEIVCVKTKDKQTYFESDIKYEYRVTNTFRDEVVKVFYRAEYENSDTSTETGVKTVEFSPNGSQVIAKNEDGTIEVFELQ